MFYGYRNIGAVQFRYALPWKKTQGNSEDLKISKS
jgi:hypothetical protein